MPRVSVLIPVRNAEPTLGAALRSVERQTLSDWECLVVDDGSRDESLVVASGFQRRDARFRVIAGHAGGVAASANRGLAECRSDWVARLDADDFMHRRRLALQLEYAEARAIECLGTHVRLFPESRLGPGMRAYQDWINSLCTSEDLERERFIECPLANPSLLCRRELLTSYQYRSCGWPEDYDLILRLLRDGRRLDVLPRRLIGWRHGPGRLTTDHPDYTQARFTAAKAHYLARGFLAGQATFVLWGYGGTGRSLRRALLAHGRRPSHIVEVHPRRLENTIHGAPVIPPEQLEQVRGRPLLVSVAGSPARVKIRAHLDRFGYREGRDYFMTA